MSPTKHTIASGVVSLTFAYVTQSLSGAFFCFLSGIFIDLDHVLDFWIARKRPPFGFRDLHSFCAHAKDGKFYLALHSYELQTVFWLIILSLKLNVVWIGLAAGMTAHLLLDQIFNHRVRPFAYFTSYRFKNGFSGKCVFRKEYYETF